jgi:hypothetical protein
MFKKVDSEFPIFIWSNFLTLDKKTRTDLMNIVLENKKKNHHGVGGSFKIDYDPTSFFADLYSKFFKVTYDFFGELNVLPNNSSMCWSYSSNNVDHGPGMVHNHINTSTINSVYYLNVPDSATIENGSIQFFMNNKTFSYRPNRYDLVMFPNYLDHKINYLNDSEYRISINMEILCNNDPHVIFL